MNARRQAAQSPYANKEYSFFKHQIYDFMYTEDQKEIEFYSAHAGLNEYEAPTNPTKKLHIIDCLLKLFMCGLAITLLIKILPIFIASHMVMGILTGIGGLYSLTPFIFSLEYKKRYPKTNELNHKTLWMQSPNFLRIFPSLLKAYVRTTAWLHDMVAAIPRLVRYYTRKGTQNATFEDCVKRNGAWGSLLGSICTIGGLVAISLFLFNPYTLFGTMGLLTAISIGLLVVPRIVKCFEFLGRLIGVFKTKKLVEKELPFIEMEQIAKKKSERDQQPTSRVAFVHTLPKIAELSKMREEGKDIPDYYYHLESEDKQMNWACYSVKGAVATLKPCYEIPFTDKSNERELKAIADENQQLKKELKGNIDKIYTKYYESKDQKNSIGSIITLNQAEAEELQLEKASSLKEAKATAPTLDKKDSKDKPIIFHSNSQICTLTLKDLLKPRNYAARPSTESILFHPSHPLNKELSILKEKGAHLESNEGIEKCRKKLYSSYVCNATVFRQLRPDVLTMPQIETVQSLIASY